MKNMDNPVKSRFFDKMFSTFSTLQNVDNSIVSLASLIKNRGIWKNIGVKIIFPEEIKTIFFKFFEKTIAHFLRKRL